MQKKSRLNIEDVYTAHKSGGFKEIVELVLNNAVEIITAFPTKPSPKDEIAAEEFAFINQFLFAKDKNWITPFDKVSKDWLDSGVCDICFSYILEEYCDYLNPKQNICLSSESLLNLIKFFKENFHFDSKGLIYWKYKLENDKFVVIDKNFKNEKEVKTNEELPQHNLIKIDKKYKTYKEKVNGKLVGSVLWSLIEK